MFLLFNRFAAVQAIISFVGVTTLSVTLEVLWM